MLYGGLGRAACGFVACFAVACGDDGPSTEAPTPIEAVAVSPADATATSLLSCAATPAAAEDEWIRYGWSVGDVTVANAFGPTLGAAFAKDDEVRCTATRIRGEAE